MDRLMALLLVVILALTGCAGGPIDGTVTSTGELTTTPPPVEEAPFPDGAAADSINATQVADGHRAALRDAGSYALTSNQTTLIRNRSSALDIGARVNFDEDAVVGQTTQRGHRQEQVIRFYASNGTGVTQRTVGNSTQFGRYPSNSSAASLSDQLTGNTIRDVLHWFEFEATDTERRDGKVLIAYESTTVNGSGAGPETNSGSQLANNSSATVLIDETGVIRRLTVQAMFDSGTKLDLSMTHSDIGSATVERPDWADTAVSQTTPVPREPEVSIETTQENATLETSGGTISAPIVTFHHQDGEPLNRSKLQVLVGTAGGPVPGYDVTALSVPEGQLESTSPLAGSGPIEPGDSIRVVHVVPARYHDSIRLNTSAGALTAADGAVADGRLSSGDRVALVWTGKQRPIVLATYEVE